MSIYRTRGAEGDYLIRGTGDAATDNANVATCVAELNEQGYGTLWIEGDVRTTELHSFNDAAINLRGSGGRGRLLHSGAGGVFMWWITNGSPSPSASHEDIEVTTAGDDWFTASGWTPVPGQFVVLYSDDEVSYLYPHFGVTGSTRPGELHIVERYDSSTGKAYVEGPILDQMVTNGKAIVYPTLLNDVQVADLTFEFEGDTQNDYAYALLFYGNNNLRVQNVRIARYGPGGIFLKNCMNPRVTNYTIDGTYRADGVYGMVATFTNGLIVSNFQGTGTRHVFTTGSGMTSGVNRIGGPINTVVDGGVINNPIKYAEAWDAGTDYSYSSLGAPWVTHNGSIWKAQYDPPLGAEPGVHASWGSAQSYSRIVLDTHPEGINTTFRNLTVSAESGFYCASTRSRKTKYQNCTFRGKPDGLGYGILVYGPDVTITGCVFENLLCPIRVSAVLSDWLPLYDYALGAVVLYGGAAYRATSNPTVGDVPGVAASWTLAADEDTVLSWMREALIANNTFRNCRGPIRVEAGTGHRITQNTFFRSGRLSGGSPLYSESVISLRTGTGHRVLGNTIEIDTEGGVRSVDIWDLQSSAVKIAGNALVGFATALDPTQESMCIGRLLNGLTPDHTTEMFYYPAHGLAENDWGYFGVLSGGAVPTGISLGTRYWISMTGVGDPTNYFKVTTSYGGAPVSFTDNGTYSDPSTGGPLLLFRGVVPSLDSVYLAANSAVV